MYYNHIIIYLKNNFPLFKMIMDERGSRRDEVNNRRRGGGNGGNNNWATDEEKRRSGGINNNNDVRNGYLMFVFVIFSNL